MNDWVRLSSSVGLMEDAAGIFGRITDGNINSPFAEVYRESKVLTAFTKQIEIPFICFLSLTFTGFLELTGFISSDSANDVERTTLEDKIVSNRS